MGAAIKIFKRSRALLVGRERFIPVKKTNDLLLVRSDVYDLDEKYMLKTSKRVGSLPNIDLDPRFYKTEPQLDLRLSENMPSFLKCRSLSITGDVTFGPGIRLIGDVVIETEKPIVIKDTVIGDERLKISDGKIPKHK